MSEPTIKVENAVKITSYLIAIMAFLSIAVEINIFFSLLFAAIIISSIYLEYKGALFRKRWMLNTISILIVFLALLRLDLSDFVIQFIEALTILLSIKFLEEKKFRDYMQIYFISLILLAGAALLSIDLIFLLYFLLLSFLLSLSIVLLTFFSEKPDLEFKVKQLMGIITKSSIIPLLAIPLTVVMFIILPRTSYPLFSYLNRDSHARSGFSDNVKLGDVSDIQENSDVIFRAKMKKLSPYDLYWRGLSLDHFDGSTWTRIEDTTPWGDLQKVRVPGREIIRQTIYLEPYDNRYLFALDKPIYIKLKKTKVEKGLVFSRSKKINKRIKYEASSIPSNKIYDKDIDMDIYLQLPDKISPDVKSLAKGLTSGQNDRQALSTIISFFRKGAYSYSLDSLPLTDTPLDHFLFKSKQGNCEYFASATAVMLRLSGVPARLVGGYKDGVYNNMGNYYVVSQKNAHIWVEAFLQGMGWLRVDTTPGSGPGSLLLEKEGFLFKIRLFFDTFEYYWNDFVINYNFNTQLKILNHIKAGAKKAQIKRSFDSIGMEELLKKGLIIAALSGLIFFISIKVLKKRSREERVLTLFLKRVGRHGYKKRASSGLEEFAGEIKEPELRESAMIFIKEFESYYYRDRELTRDDFINLTKKVRGI